MTPFPNAWPVPKQNLYSPYALLRVLISNKNLCVFLDSRNGNNNLIWSWNNPAKNALSGLELYSFGLEYPFGPNHFGSRLPFRARTPFWATNTLLGHEYPFETKLSFQDKDILSGQDALAVLECPFGSSMPFLVRDCPFRLIMPLFIANALLGRQCPFSGRKRQSTIAGIPNNNQPQQASRTLIPYFPRVHWVW